jgi:hypothetical protein
MHAARAAHEQITDPGERRPRKQISAAGAQKRNAGTDHYSERHHS